MQINILEFLKILLKKETIDILLTHYTDPRGYPTELYTINILRKEGFNVKEICIKVDKNSNIEDETTFIFIGKRGKRFYYLFNYPLFCLTIFLYVLFKKPKIIFTYETFAFMPAFITAKIFNIPIIYHIHDINDPKGLRFLGRIINKFEYKCLKYTNLLSMTDKKKFFIYSKFTRLPEKKIPILNAVSLFENFIGESKIKRILEKYKSIKKWIIRTGGLGDDQCIKELILSLKYLPEEIGILLVGKITDDYRKEVEFLISENGFSERVIILNYFPRNEILSFLKYAFIGITIYKIININLITPTSIKLAEFIASGIPAVVNDSEYFRELNKKVGSFVFADPYSPESIAKAILKVYKDKKLYKKLCENAKKAYKTFYNFEYQFEPVLKEIKKWVKK